MSCPIDKRAPDTRDSRLGIADCTAKPLYGLMRLRERRCETGLEPTGASPRPFMPPH